MSDADKYLVRIEYLQHLCHELNQRLVEKNVIADAMVRDRSSEQISTLQRQLKLANRKLRAATEKNDIYRKTISRFRTRIRRAYKEVSSDMDAATEIQHILQRDTR